MFLHDKKNTYKKIFLVSALALMLVMVVCGLVRHIQKEADAITAEGESVSVSGPEPQIYYDDWGTFRYTATVGSNVFPAYCANPGKNALYGTYKASILSNTTNNKKIKLMIYVSTVSNSVTQSVMEEFFPSYNSDKRYAYSHAVIGAIYANDYTGLRNSSKTMVDNIITELGNMITDQHDAWVMAKDYTLYKTDRSGTDRAGDSYQDVVWIEENGYGYGSIKVQKKDSDTQTTTPQGGASLQGITFKVYNNSGAKIYNPRTGNIYANGAEVASGTTDANGEVTFSNLVLGTYSVKETSTNSSYDLTSTSSQGVTLSTNGQTATLTFYDNVKKGSIEVSKNDAELNSCNQLGKGKFAGIKFQVINNSAKPIIYNGTSIAKGSVVAEKTLGATDCKATFNNLPYGSYIVKELGSGTGYINDSTTHNVTIPTDGSSSIKVSFNNQVIRGDVKFKKVNQKNEAMANIPFRITSKTTGESHIVITNSNGVVNTSASVNIHSNHTNGYDSTTNFDNAIYQGYGTWFGKSASSNDIATVNDSLGALPYDTYEIVEIACAQNDKCRDLESQQKTFEIKTNTTVVDLGNWENDCTEFTLSTTAKDNADNDKFVTADTQSKIKDTIQYCLRTGETYTIKGTLMDKTTGQLIKVGGSAIEKSITITPATECGETTMTFTVDTSLLAGHEIVVYEKAYLGNELIVSHEDINDAAQTVNVISLSTTAKDNADNDKFVTADTQSKIKDTIQYCLRTGETYTIKGTLMDKTTGQLIKVGGSAIEKSITITPATECGETTMTFTVDTSLLAGHEIVVFEGLYLGNDLVISHEDVNDVAQTVNVIFLSTTAIDNEDEDKFVFIDTQSKIKDTIQYCLRAGEAYTIEGTLMDRATNQLIKDGDNAIQIHAAFTPVVNCGKTTVTFTVDTSLLAGHEIVVFEKVYLGDKLLISHEDINDNAQTVKIIDLTTFATDDASEEESKDILASGIVKIKDTVKYCLVAGKEFTIKGVLMNKDTREKLLINGEAVEQTLTITPEEDCGEAEMFYEFDATGLGNMSIVIFENVYYGNKLIIEHNDFENLDETFYLFAPAPDTGYTTGSSNGVEHPIIVLIAISAVFIVVAGYLGIRIKARRSYLWSE